MAEYKLDIDESAKIYIHGSTVLLICSLKIAISKNRYYNRVIDYV